MTVVSYCGNFRAPESTENHWRYAFTQLGCEFVPIQQDEASEQEWEAAASDADLALWSTTWGWPLPGDAHTWDRIARRGVKTASLHLDLIIGLEREHDLLIDRRDHPQFRGPEIVWTADGSHDERWKAYDIPHRWLPPAIHEPNALLGVPQEQYECDVVWTGSVRGYHPEHKRRTQLIDGARNRYGTRLHLHGNEWGNTVRGPELSDVYASARVVLGDSLCLGGCTDRYFSDRVPETAGRGGMLVHPWNQATPDFMACAQWSDWSVTDQLDLVDEVLAWDPVKRDARRIEAHRHVLANHTYTARAQMVLAAFGLAQEVAA